MMAKVKAQRAKPLASATEWVDEGMKDPATRERVEGLLAEMRVVQDLAALRKAVGVTQVELAKRVGISQPSVAQIEGGRAKDIKLSTLVRIAAALGAHVRISFEPSAAAALPKQAARARSA
jgi:DNA-binding XRE family transcriptional regulator